MDSLVPAALMGGKASLLVLQLSFLSFVSTLALTYIQTWHPSRNMNPKPNNVSLITIIVQLLSASPILSHLRLVPAAPAN
jgi:hypothetical protein